MSDGFEKRFNALSDVSDLMDDSILAIDLTLKDNPGPDESRRLWQRRDGLVREKAVLEMRIAALLDAPTVDPPDAAQVKEIAALTAEVERATQGARTASATLEFTNRALELADQVASAPVAG